MQSTGTFQVQVTREPPYFEQDGLAIGRATVAKQFAGDLVATSTVHMTGVGTPVEGSMGYVAIEVVTGTLGGKPGTFVLQHSGQMAAGSMSLEVKVVPGSGIGELRGLRGAMKIDIVGKDHFYTLDYELDG